MKKIEKGSTKHLIVLICAIAIAGIILYPLFDMVFCALITKSEFVYSVPDHVIEPIIFGMIIGIIFWIIEKHNETK